MLSSVVSAIGQVVEAGGSVVGYRGGTEEPHYVVEHELDGVEIRRYGPRVAAQTTVSGTSEDSARSRGFRRLAGYIFGGNHADTKIAMTAPVAQQSGRGRGEKIAMTAPVAQQTDADGDWVIRFFMPSDKTMDNLPEPNDPTVTLVTVPAETVAVLRFTGSYSRRAISSNTEKLLAVLRDNGLEPDGAPVAWFYDPPWTIPMRRRNEVAVAVTTSTDTPTDTPTVTP
ncbi:heme-binding protein [Mycobacterium sp.]|uniref:SOUL family heme-binding protein n=1 Tax=Mycobacterium sp. TaxID=1785 RepID=UPI0031CEDAF3